MYIFIKYKSNRCIHGNIHLIAHTEAKADAVDAADAADASRTSYQSFRS